MKRLPHLIVLICSLSAASLFAADSNDAVNKAYIEGFLAGAQLTDSEIISKLEGTQQGEQDSGFFKRAFETRIGSARDPAPATFYAGFCLPGDTVNTEVINRILEEVNSAENPADSDKASRIFRAVRTQYPCQ